MSQAITPQVLSMSPQALEMLPVNTRVNLLAMIERLENYISKMAPGVAVDPRSGGQLQMVLWTNIRQILKQPPEIFTPMYTELLQRFHLHRNGCFSKRYVFRFMEHTTLKGNDRRNFERVVNLLQMTAAPKSRNLVARQMDLGRILKDFPDPSVIEKLSFYYAI